MKVFRPLLMPFVAILPAIWTCGRGHSDREKNAGDTPYSEIIGDEESSPEATKVVTEAGAPVDTKLLGTLIAHFKFTRNMDSEIINFLRYDFGTLASWTEQARQAELVKLGSLYGLTAVNAKTVSQWLTDRITYIYPDGNEPLRFAFIVPDESRVYQFSLDTGDGERVAASNIGGGLYSFYLDQKETGVGGLLVNFDDKYLPFLSPRMGVMQIGPSFFDSSDSLDTSNLSRRGFRTIKSLYRLSILFHEARHSDGNAQAGTLSFAHINCPADGSVAEEYEGLPACDDKSNGAYAIGGQALKALAGVCDGICSARELNVLEAIQLDVFSRILVEDTEANYGDATPEPLLPAIDTTNFETVAE